MAGLLAAVLPGSAAAQMIGGRVLFADTRAPVEGAIVLLVDAEGRTLARALADARGGFRILHDDLSAPGLALRAERIGLGVATLPLDDHTGPIEILLEDRPIEIDGIEVGGVDRCPAHPLDASLAEAWARFRPLLESLQQLEPAEGREFVIRYSEVRLSANGVEDSVLVQEDFRTDAPSPFSTADPEFLADSGFVVERPGDTVEYFGPDARLLLSESFIATHCYRLAENQDRDGYLLIEFEPQEWNRERNIRGVFALPTDPEMPPRIEYEFTSHPWGFAPDPRLGGFSELYPTDFGWLVGVWELRVPGAPPMLRLNGAAPLSTITAFRGSILRVLEREAG